jgi:hypothetical protein
MAGVGFTFSKGVWGSDPAGYGVYGDSTSGYGVYGDSSSGYGVEGHSDSNWGVKGSGTSGVWGQATASNGTGVAGSGLAGNGVAGSTGGGAAIAGVSGTSTGLNGNGVHGVANNGALAYGVWGESAVGIGVAGWSSGNWGVHGRGTSGVWGQATASNGTGVSGSTTGGIGVHGTASSGWAGWFDGNVNITGSCCAAGMGTYRIDHPADPEGKYLVQAAVQSPDIKAVYDGIATLDARGESTVTLPSYVEEFNTDFRYQLTCIGGYAPVYVAQEITGSSFKIAGGKADMKVSWQVTGIRKDPYALAHPIEVEVEKPAEEQGSYLHPIEHGQPESKGIRYEELQRMEETTLPQAKKP